MTRTLVLTLALLAGGCCFGGSAPPEPEPDWSHGPAGDRLTPPIDGLFWYGGLVWRADGVSAPPRLHASIPTSLTAIRDWPDDAAPQNQVRARLYADDAVTVSAWLDAAAIAAHDAPAIDVADAYATMARYADGALVSDLRGRATTTPAAGAHETVMLALAMQGAAEDEALFTAADAAPSATLAWMTHRIGVERTQADGVRLRTALEAHLAAYTPTDAYLDPCGVGVDAAVVILDGLGRAGDLVAMASRLTGAHADCLAMSLGEVADPRAQALFTAACPAHRDAEICAQHRAPGPRALQAPYVAPPSSDEVRPYDLDPATFPRSGPAFESRVRALEACANDDEDRWEAQTCLTSLATLDRARAVTLARAWLPAHPDAAGEGDAARGLDAFPESGSVVAYLRDRGLVEPDDDVSHQADAVSPRDVLDALGHTARFDTETDQYPNEHDTLLVQLATLAPEAMRGVAFEEVVQGTPGGVDLGSGVIVDGVVDDEGEVVEGDAPEGNYLLHAYDDHARYELAAENLGDWYDVDAVIGLLNAVAHEHGSDVRWLMLETGDQSGVVIAGPAAGLRQMVTDHWLVPSGLGASAASRDAERAILEQILGEQAH